MTERIRKFLKKRREDGPCLVVDLDVIRENYGAFAKTLPDTRVFYAVKANPAPEVLKLLADLGSSFDTASPAEIEMVLAAGATADRISYGNTIKKERDIARAYDLGVRLFAVDCEAEVEKIARAAPGSRVFCRILCDGSGAEWPLSRKFGCVPEMAPGVLEHAHRLGLIAHGISFHVGSQQNDVKAWDAALASAAKIFHEMSDRGLNLSMVNLGGGLPRALSQERPEGRCLREVDLPRAPEALRQPHPGNHHRAGPRPRRRRRRDRSRGRADFQEIGRRSRALGLSRHRQVRRSSASSAVSPRRSTNRSATRSAPRRTAARSPLA